ncbi:MAG: gephyrin-like molybdotransferase Glp [Pseudomonadota bacterium]
MSAPPLKNDCFAMPPGVAWTPVDEALARLRAGLGPVVAPERVALDAALGRVLARPVIARRSHPPYANAAVDGYALAHAALPAGEAALPLAEGRAAAGAPFAGAVPGGHALRILTGAMLPAGADTVALEEDCLVEAGEVRFGPGLKPGANTRAAGEDVEAGETVLQQGQRLRPQDLALAASVGVAEVEVYRPLRVGVLSTGDEILPVGATPAPHQMFDANRPMLLSLLRAWGCVPVDLGQAPDRAEAVQAHLAEGLRTADAILTTGGASAGDEDHVSALLRREGVLSTWRIALKPGRPLALANWHGVPIFGLPGNPVAAFVCALVFARPALLALSGAGWQVPEALEVPAAFSKRKKPGRREYLRARLRDGRAEVFASEGSGRVSGLSWADGLVELEDGGREIAPGDPVRWLPFSGYGL